MNFLSQTVHSKGLSCSWTNLSWRLRRLFSMKHDGLCEHCHGFSSECTEEMCDLSKRLNFELNEQLSQLNNVLCLCTPSICRAREYLKWNDFWHRVQWCCVSFLRAISESSFAIWMLPRALLRAWQFLLFSQTVSLTHSLFFTCRTPAIQKNINNKYNLSIRYL